MKPDTESPIIFLHIPKAAGSSLLAILQRHYPKSQTFYFDWRDIPASIAALKALPRQQQERYSFLCGHIGFGGNRFLPPAGPVRDDAAGTGRPDRFALPLCEKDPEPLSVQNDPPEESGLGRIVSGGYTTEMINGQTRLISGLDPDKCPSEEVLAAAKKNLRDHFLFTGISELFDPSLLLLQDAMGWRRPPFYVSRNIAFTGGRGRSGFHLRPSGRSMNGTPWTK